MDAGVHAAEGAGVDEEGFAAAVAEGGAVESAAVLLVLGEEPETDRYLGGIEELAGHGDDAIDQVGFDDVLADLAFAGGVGGERAVGEDEAGDAVGSEVVEEVLDPGVVGVADRRDAVLPALVFAQAVAAPVADVEGRIGEDVVGPEIGVQVAVEGVGVFRAEIGFDAANGEVHLGEPPGGGVALLTEDGDVVSLAAVGFDELLRLDEHAARAAAGVVDAALVGFEHFDQDLHDRLRGCRTRRPACLRRWRTGRGSIRRRGRGCPASVALFRRGRCR